MSHILGVYWSPGHQRPTDIDYMRRLQPPAIRVLDPDPNQLAIAHKAAPNALILPRDWALSEQHDDVRSDPVGTGKRHAQEWRSKLDRWDDNYEDMPPDEQIIVVGMNELHVWEMLPQAVEYTVAMLDECTRLGLRACALNLSVGWPANNGADTKPDWTPYAPVEGAIKRGNHILVLHSYWYKSGPQDGAGWWAWRHRACPWDVPIIIGECSVDLYVDMPRWENDGKPNRGWRGNMSPDTYAAQMEEYARGCDRRVIAILPFLTDYRSNNWESFDTAEAHNALLARKDRMIPQATQPAPSPTPVKVPTLTHPIQDPAKRVISQPFGGNAEDYAKFGLAGHNGIDFAVPMRTPIGAVDSGVVQESGNLPDYGEYVKLRHAWGESLYAHLRNRSVEAGEPINRGSIIGNSGNTGNSTGPHLHFAIRVNPYQRGGDYDGYVDPAPYLGDVAQPAPKPNQHEIVKLICEAALEFGVDSDLLLSQAWAESSFNPQAVSSAGAKGLLQLMPATWDEWSAKVDGGADPFDARQNARVGAAYMRWLIRQTNGNTYRALQAYVWGIGNIVEAKEPPGLAIHYANKIVHGRDLLKAVG